MSTKIEINDNTSVKPNAGLAYVITAVDANGKPTDKKLIYEKEHTYDWDNPLKSFKGSCTEEGYIIYPCMRYSECGGTYTKYTGTLDHTYEYNEGDFDDAYHYYTCSVCGEKTSASHEYSTSTIAPTCGTDGKIIYTCAICGQQYEETIPATGNHNWGPWFPELDIYHNRECTRCGQLYDNSGMGIPCDLKAIDDDQHKCFTCGRTENHSYGNSSICGMCDHPCSHSNRTYTPNHEIYSSHDWLCKSCHASQIGETCPTVVNGEFTQIEPPSLDDYCFVTSRACPNCGETWEYEH